MSDNMFSAGWYPDPENAQQQRYWDGHAWTSHTAPNGTTPTQTQPLPVARQTNTFPRAMEAAPAKTPFWKRKWVMIGAGAFAALVLIGSLAPKDDQNTAAATQPSTSSTTSAAPSTTQPTTAPVAAPASTSSTSSASAQETSETSTPSGSTSESSTTTMAPFIMPSEVGKGLQAAQDHIQSVSGDPFYISLSDDALALGRPQINDSNWHVCSQSPAPGSTVTSDLEVTFTVAKLDEACP